MHRLAPVLLIGGALLFANGVYAPAAPIPAATPSAPDPALVQAAPIMADVSSQVDRLRQRRQATPEEPDLGRDPFRFGRPRPTEANTLPVPAAAPEPAAPVVTLPRFIAVVATETAQGTVRKAVLSQGDGVRIYAVGDTAGAFVITAIDASSVSLQDPGTSAVYRLTLR
ncbi:MAG: hypothetical protein R2752_04035 [Vicinamibacterales bacterium]